MIDSILQQLGIASTEYEYIVLIFKGVLTIIIITEIFGWLKSIFNAIGGR